MNLGVACQGLEPHIAAAAVGRHPAAAHHTIGEAIGRVGAGKGWRIHLDDAEVVDVRVEAPSQIAVTRIVGAERADEAVGVTQGIAVPVGLELGELNVIKIQSCSRGTDSSHGHGNT